MERVEAAYQAGVAEACDDIAAGQPRLRYGARGAWGEDLAQTLRARFGVELIVLSCLTDAASSSFEAGYNRTVEAHIDGVHGPGSVAAVWAEIQRRRKEGYDAWATEQATPNRTPRPMAGHNSLRRAVPFGAAAAEMSLWPERAGIANEDLMVVASTDRISFIELAKRVVENVRKPMTAAEIWHRAQQTGLAALLQSGGKTPEASLGARLYTDVQKPSSLFVKLGSGPAQFLLKSLAGSIPDLASLEVTQPTPEPEPKNYPERDLHPLLVWFADNNFSAHCRTIYHERSLKGSLKQNQWVHPDVVGFALTTQDWTHEVVQLAQHTGAPAVRIYSFELKISLGFPTLREYFFQAVSNSSWAHEGYLVAADIDADPDFQAELTRLSQSFGIGVIQLNTAVPADSAVMLAARQKTEIDWKTADRIAAINPDFKQFVGAVTNSVKINQPAVNGFDKLLADAALEVHLQKMLAG